MSHPDVSIEGVESCPEALVAGAASRRHGLVTRSDALALGMTNRMIRERLSAGRWISMGRGLYRIAGVPVTWEQRVLATCLLGGAGAVASHHSAGVLWGLSGIGRGRPEVTLRRGASPEGAALLGRVHSSRSLEVDEVTALDHIPVTRPVRTVIDLAGQVSLDTLTEVVDDTVCRRLLSFDQLASQASRLRQGRPSRQLRLVLATWEPGPRPDSKAELTLERHIVGKGLPKPVRQHEVQIGSGAVRRLDLAWPAIKLGVELQGRRWHSSPEQFDADRHRILELRSSGWDIIEVTPRMLAEDQDQSLFKAISLALSRAGRPG
ncbi:MAG: type IV toxin-antitoxin system AbiEi family antitoxin domain-containing protein [Acidimicrobiales bacterium]